MSYKTLLLTERSERHQASLLNAAPDMLAVTVLSHSSLDLLYPALREAVFVISERRGHCDAEFFAAAPNLKMLLRLGSQTDDINLAAAQARGIVVAYEPLPSVQRVAEHAIMQMLILVKHLREAEKIALATESKWGESQRTNENTFAYNWSKRQAVGGLVGKSIGLLGFGEIGMEITKRLQTWGVTLLYSKRQPLSSAIEQAYHLNYRNAEALLRESDILVNLLPYSLETNLFLNVERLSWLKRGALLVNVGSGAIIDESALADSLRFGYIAGAALDTYEYEPLQVDNPLIALAHAETNLWLTPHIAAGTMSLLAENQALYANLQRFLNNEPLMNRLV